MEHDALNVIKNVSTYNPEAESSPYTCSTTNAETNPYWAAEFVLKIGQTNGWTVKQVSILIDAEEHEGL